MQKPKLFTSAYNLKTSNDSNYASITAPTADHHQHPLQCPGLNCMWLRAKSILIPSMISIKQWKGGS